ncbi:MAG: MBL fold metallo-hydrolase [Lachnospiraceae bacterium]|nr:MBL fold metallo-hydrolase [Lachnospiraceae bacterium]
MEPQGPPLEMIFGNYMPWKIDDTTWVISFMEGSEFIYLLEGDEYALLLDTGYGIGHLRELAERLTDKKILVANTHFHPDHSAGNGEWEEVMVSSTWEIDAPSVNNPGAGPVDLNALPHPDYRKKLMHDGDIIDLGGRKIRVLDVLPAHCNSSLFFVDEDHKMLFTGDEYESHQTIMYDNSCNPDAPYHVEKRLENLKANALRLKEIVGEGWYLLPNHNGTPIALSYLDGYVALVDAIFDGTATIEDKLNHRFIEMDPKAPELCRVRHASVSIFIKKAEVLKVYGTRK